VRDEPPLVFRPARRIPEIKTSRFVLAESRRRLIWWSRTLDTLSTVEMCPVVAAASVGRFGSSRPVGRSTCAAYSRSQNLSFWLAEGRFRLIWWSRTLDTLATVEMCPVVAAASIGRVRTFRGFTSATVKRSQVALEHPALPARRGACGRRYEWEPPLVFRPALRIHEAKTCRFGFAESRRRLIWWSRTLVKLATVGMCPVVAAATVVRVRACRGFTSAAVKRSQVALEHPALPARLASGAGRDHQTFAVIAALSRVCTPKLGDLPEGERRARGFVREKGVVQAVDELRRRPRDSGCKRTRGQENPRTREPAKTRRRGSATTPAGP
jgi:hypothetical protein